LISAPQSTGVGAVIILAGVPLFFWFQRRSS
jgi:hypothetical protein